MSEKIETGGPAFPRPQGGDAGMTLRQYAAIKLRVPNSGTDWLDEMIRESLRDGLAVTAMQALVSNDALHEIWRDWFNGNEFESEDSVVHPYATAAYGIANAMIERGEVKNGQG